MGTEVKKHTIALVGNPNAGKTTLFNGLTGGNIKTGNWPGVTVEKREGMVKNPGEAGPINVVDLPGIYSFAAQSEDERVARDYALSGEADTIVNIVDAANLERNLYLTTQLIEMKVPVLLVLNMVDIARNRGIDIDQKALSKSLGVPVVAAAAIEKQGIAAIKDAVVAAALAPTISDKQVEYPNEIEDVVGEWQKRLDPLAQKLGIDHRWLSIKTLEDDPWVSTLVQDQQLITPEEIAVAQDRIEEILDDTPDILCADQRYGFIHGVCSAVVQRRGQRRSTSDKIDKVVLNRLAGIPIFLVAMYLVFWLTITVGGAFIDFFDILFGSIFVDGFSVLLQSIDSPPWLVAILAGGIGAGIQTVATFVPIIGVMFLMLAILEDSGYMARAAFVMDRVMRALGLPGKSFVPLIVGFGCTVPAVLATRTLESKKDRLMTIFMAPFMSCGARLPVYALFVAAFFQVNGGLVVFSLYLVGIVFAVLTGLLMKKTVFKEEASYFVMELPPYHAPRFRHIFRHTRDRLGSFVLRSGKAIILVVTLLSVLNSWGTDGSFGNEDSQESVLAAVGKAITPVFEPMGIEEENWPATVGLFTGLFAKEAVVGTLNSLYGQIAQAQAQAQGDGVEAQGEQFDLGASVAEAFGSIPENLSGIWGGLRDPLGTGIVSESDTAVVADEVGADEAIFGTMGQFFSKGQPQAYAYLLFILLYFPCVAAFGAVIQETGTFMGILNALYLTILGWVTATLFYQFAVAMHPLYIGLALALLAMVIVSFVMAGRQYNRKRLGAGV